MPLAAPKLLQSKNYPETLLIYYNNLGQIVNLFIIENYVKILCTYLPIPSHHRNSSAESTT